MTTAILTKAKFHFRHPRRGGPYCGQTGTKKRQTDRWEDVTCGSCRRQKPKEGPGEPMSIHRPFDNAAAWLDDEPWRTW